ncbi:hypothetical protein PoB_002013500 [Plakobranchus ocellatus]|uniref:Uncharacterized protein n=1 Tax=Plakobranchus ocellatus TaxID=259542 RepID=A0AAV3ZEP7_9GAST|nr:hypothetical protein PoB_002013500 [Plakobranchus ocellatus]
MSHVPKAWLKPSYNAGKPRKRQTEKEMGGQHTRMDSPGTEAHTGKSRKPTVHRCDHPDLFSFKTGALPYA